MEQEKNDDSDTVRSFLNTHAKEVLTTKSLFQNAIKSEKRIATSDEIKVSPKHKYVKPKLGSQYQAKIPRYEDDHMNSQTKITGSSKTSKTENKNTTFGLTKKGFSKILPIEEKNVRYKSYRSPCRIHQPMKSNNPTNTETFHHNKLCRDFLIFVQNVFFQSHEDIDTESQTLSSRRSKRSHDMLSCSTPPHDVYEGSYELTDSEFNITFPFNFENDERVLRFLEEEHKGNVNRAKVSIMIQLNQGIGGKKRKFMTKKKETKGEVNPVGWRGKLAQVHPKMLGDLSVSQSNNSVYSHRYFISCQKEDDSVCTDITRSNENVNITSNFDWTGFLCTSDRIIERTKSSKEIKPYLREILRLIRFATIPSSSSPSKINIEHISSHADKNLEKLTELSLEGRTYLAQLLDASTNVDGSGVDIDRLKSCVKAILQSCPVQLEELTVIQSGLEEVSSWECDVRKALCDSTSTSNDDLKTHDSIQVDARDDIKSMEVLIKMSKKTLLRSKSMVEWDEKLERAKVLRSRILEWEKSTTFEKSQSMKFVSTLVKEANKLGFVFPELIKLNTSHKRAEMWFEHATRASRCRISLMELEEVVKEGENLPLNVSDMLDRLKMKLNMAHHWIIELKVKVSCDEEDFFDGAGINTSPDYVRWSQRLRCILNNEDKDAFRSLLNLAVDGSRIQVDMELLRLLNLEMEARNWYKETGRLVSNSSGRKAKIDELYTHVSRGEKIYNRISSDAPYKETWVLPGEDELKRVVKSTNEWYDKYQLHFGSRAEGSSKNESGSIVEKCSTSISEIRKFVNDGDKLPVNLGPAFGKVTRILSRAETWLNENIHVIKSCGIDISCSNKTHSFEPSNISPISIEQLNSALTGASDLPSDLEDINKLKSVVRHVESWIERANVVVPKRQSKRNTRGKTVNTSSSRNKANLNELTNLIDDASNLPPLIAEDLDRLTEQFNLVQSWRIQAQCEFRSIITGFQILHAERKVLITKEDKKVVCTMAQNSSFDGTKNCSQDEKCMTESGQVKYTAILPVTNVNKRVDVLIKNLLDSARSIRIYTLEEKLAEFLNEVVSWCMKAATVTPDEFLEKTVLATIPALIRKGMELLEYKLDFSEDDPDDQVKEFLPKLKVCWSLLLNEEYARLIKYQKRGNEYQEWVKKAEMLLSGLDKFSLSLLEESYNESLKYPTTELVRMIRRKGKDIALWIKDTRDILENSRKITLTDAQSRITKGEELGLNCNELKLLRGQIRKTKAWGVKVSKISLDEGQTEIADIKKLIDEHDADSFLVTIPEDILNLKQAIRGYCLCRNPYEGFMIGCDGCDEWYHGLCIGISEAQAGKYEKYLCIRCLIRRSYNDCKNEATQIFLKWKNENELGKSRNNVFKNFQKRLRKANADIAKYEKEVDELKEHIHNCHQAMGSSNSSHLTSEQNQNLINLQSVFEGGVSTLAVKDDETMDVLEVQGRLRRATASLSNVRMRLESLCKEENLKKVQFENESRHSRVIHKWLVKVAKEIFVPESMALARKNMPPVDGSLSPRVEELIEEAANIGLSKYQDISTIVNIMKCLTWSLRALKILSRKPHINEIESLVISSTSIKFPNEKSVKFLRGMIQRASSFQVKVCNALKPERGETKPYDLLLLTQLVIAARNVPMITIEEGRLISTIEDRGNRHCFCGGPSDGRFMLSCDKCELWFHGSCVGMDQSTVSPTDSWVCCLCKERSVRPNTQPAAYSDVLVNHDTDERAIISLAQQEARPQVLTSTSTLTSTRPTKGRPEIVELQPQVSSSTSTIGPLDFTIGSGEFDDLWPPLGLYFSEEATRTLGADFGCAAFLETDSSSQQEPPQMESMKPMPQVHVKPEHPAKPQVKPEALTVPVAIPVPVAVSIPVAVTVPMTQQKAEPDQELFMAQPTVAAVSGHPPVVAAASAHPLVEAVSAHPSVAVTSAHSGAEPASAHPLPGQPVAIMPNENIAWPSWLGPPPSSSSQS